MTLVSTVRKRVAAPSRDTGNLASKSLGGASFYALIDQGIVSFASALAAVMIGRACGAEQLGIYGLAVKVFWLVAGVLNALMWIPYTSVAPRLSERRRAYYLGSVTQHLAAAIVAIGLGFVAFGFLAQFTSASKPWIFQMCLALVPFSALMLLKEHLRRVLLATLETAELLFVDGPIAALQLAFLGLLIASDRLSSTTGLVAMGLACSWCFGWCWFHQRRFRFSAAKSRLHWSYNFDFGKWLVIVAVTWSLGEALCYWFVENYHGLEAMGHYSAALTTVMLFNPIALTGQNLARSILANTFAEGGKRRLWKTTLQGTGLAFLVFTPLFSILAIQGDFLVSVFFGDKFPGLGLTVASLCLGLFAWVLNFPVEGALSALQHGQSMLVGGLTRLGAIVAFGPWLISKHGTVGVGLAVAVASTAALVVQWLYLSQNRHDE